MCSAAGSRSTYKEVRGRVRGPVRSGTLILAARLRLSYVTFAMNKVNMLKYHGITPLLVFDGGHLPAKSKTEDERAK